MQTRQLKIDFNPDSPRYQQNKGPSFTIEYKFDENEYKANEWEQYPTQFDWPYISRNGKWQGQYVFDVSFYNYAKDQRPMSTVLSKDTKHHEKLLNHLINNTNKNDKLDVKLLEAIDTIKIDFQHDIKAGDVVQCIADNSPRYGIVLNVQNVNNYRDFSFKIDKIHDIGVILLDLSLPDLIVKDNEYMQQQPSHFLSHNHCNPIDLNLQEGADLRVKYGHIKYYDVNIKLQVEIEKRLIAETRLDSNRDQTLQSLGKGYNSKLNDKSKRSTTYTVSKFCGATSYARSIIPHFITLGLNYDWNGGRNYVDIPVTVNEIKLVIEDWATNIIEGDETKGESDVKFWGKNNRICYSYTTNMIAIKFSVVKRVLK